MVLDVPIRTTKDVEKLELETKFRLKQDLEKFETEIECLKNKGGFTSVDQLDAHRGDGYRDIVDNEKRRVRRVTHGDSVEIILDPAQPTVLTTVSCSYLPHSYQKIKNKVWIESQPIYKAALDEWQQNAKSHLSKAERKTLKVESLKKEIYNLIGFYSVFQGVLVTASCQSSLLQCREVGFPIILSFCASVAALFGILQKFDKIHELDSSIFKDRIKYEVCYQMGYLMLVLFKT